MACPAYRGVSNANGTIRGSTGNNHKKLVRFRSVAGNVSDCEIEERDVTVADWFFEVHFCDVSPHYAIAAQYYIIGTCR